jgi:L-threonylcarbamoyladenylate synthase
VSDDSNPPGADGPDDIDPLAFDAAEDIDDAAAAIRDGELVVYPTETVYGLAADATDPDAIERVFEAKGRTRVKPVSLAVPDVETALDYTRPTDREERFIRKFLPGPVTVVVERREAVPDVLTDGAPKVGIRIPDHLVALALLEAAGPVTATSANVSGNPSATSVADLDAITEEAAVVLDGGETGGTGSTVVDVEAGTIHRRGANADAVERWLDEQ